MELSGSRLLFVKRHSSAFVRSKDLLWMNTSSLQWRMRLWEQKNKAPHVCITASAKYCMCLGQCIRKHVLRSTIPTAVILCKTPLRIPHMECLEYCKSGGN